MTTQIDSPLLTVDEVAAYLRVNRSTVYDLLNTSKLKYVKIGSGSNRRRMRTFVLVSDLNDYLDTAKVQ